MSYIQRLDNMAQSYKPPIQGARNPALLADPVSDPILVGKGQQNAHKTNARAVGTSEFVERSVPSAINGLRMPSLVAAGRGPSESAAYRPVRRGSYHSVTGVIRDGQGESYSQGTLGELGAKRIAAAFCTARKRFVFFLLSRLNTSQHCRSHLRPSSFPSYVTLPVPYRQDAEDHRESGVQGHPRSLMNRSHADVTA